jgi:ferredoxin
MFASNLMVWVSRRVRATTRIRPHPLTLSNMMCAHFDFRQLSIRLTVSRTIWLLCMVCARVHSLQAILWSGSRARTKAKRRRSYPKTQQSARVKIIVERLSEVGLAYYELCIVCRSCRVCAHTFLRNRCRRPCFQWRNQSTMSTK